MARPFYRLRQFLRALAARVRPDEWKIVERTLPPEAVALFRRMPAADQRHSLDVLYALRAQGYEEPALWGAALLHDVAKAEGVGLHHRVILVLLRAVHRDWLARIASPDPRSWRYALTLVLEHPRRGAEMAQVAGCLPETVELIRRHQDEPPCPPSSRLDEWLRALRAADEAN